MKIERVIQLAGMMERGNVLPEELAIEFLSEFDGLIQSDIMLHAPEEIVRYDNKDQELILRPPHDGLYVSFLVSMIRQCQGEFEGYNNAQEIVEDKLKAFRRWYIHHYRPADTGSRNYTGGTSADGFGFAYLTAYGLAVKHGYQGSEEEWLQSLHGEKGDPGEAARMRYDAQRDMIQWGIGEEWHDLYTMAQVLAPLYAKLNEMAARVEAAAEAAEGAADAAQTAKGQVVDALHEAEGHAREALAQANKAKAAAEGAAGSAKSAAESAQTAQEAAGVVEELELVNGEGGVILAPEGTDEAPVLALYGRYSDEPVVIRGAAPAVQGNDVPNLRQVQELVGQSGGYYIPDVNEIEDGVFQFSWRPSKEDMPTYPPTVFEIGGGGGYVASEEPPEDTGALWVDTSEPEEAVALGVTAVETAEGAELYCTDELGTTTVTVRHGKDGAQGPQGPDGPQGEPGRDGVIALSGAAVGQIARITAVDENGVPTAWEAVDIPSGGGGSREFELIGKYDMTEIVFPAYFSLDFDKYSEFLVYIERANAAEDSANIQVSLVFDNTGYGKYLAGTTSIGTHAWGFSFKWTIKKYTANEATSPYSTNDFYRAFWCTEKGSSSSAVKEAAELRFGNKNYHYPYYVQFLNLTDIAITAGTLFIYAR